MENINSPQIQFSRICFTITHVLWAQLAYLFLTKTCRYLLDRATELSPPKQEAIQIIELFNYPLHVHHTSYDHHNLCLLCPQVAGWMEGWGEVHNSRRHINNDPTMQFPSEILRQTLSKSYIFTISISILGYSLTSPIDQNLTSNQTQPITTRKSSYSSLT